MADEKTPLPKTPDEMPRDIYNRDNYYRNALVGSLREFAHVEISWNRDDDCDDDDDDDSTGTWDVVATDTRGRVYEGSHADFVNALWFVLEHSSGKDRTEYEAWKQARQAALAKLSRAERQMLGLAE